MINKLTTSSKYIIDNIIFKPNKDLAIDNNVTDNIFKTIDNATHLDDKAKINSKILLQDLINKKSITINDFNANRDSGVAGIQWAMELVLSGTEYIITPTLPTPFRNPFNKMQLARKESLQARLEDRAIHLFFYEIDKNDQESNEQYNNYRENIFSKYGENNNPTLFEHQLSLKDEMLAMFSGAIILNPNGNSFIIEASQDKNKPENNSQGNLKIKLFYGEIDKIIDNNSNIEKIQNLANYINFIHDIN